MAPFMTKFRAMNDTNPSPAFRPLYQQIKTLITQSLISGEWRPGEAIPSEIELAARYHVSQGTVRKAISELAAENVLIRHQGKGTFVASHSEEHHKFHFLRIVPDKGGPEYPQGELLSCRRAKADSSIAKLLEINAGASLVVIRRLQRIGESPVMYDEIRVPASLFKDLSPAQINQYHCKMYSLFEAAYGVKILQVVEQLKAVAANSDVATVLGIPQGAPVISVERLAYTFGDKPVEWRRTLCNTKECHYMNKIV